jgi:hypothetical protein
MSVKSPQPEPPITVDLLPCCRLSLAAQIELDEVDNDRTTCEWSYGADLHRLLRTDRGWRRLA